MRTLLALALFASVRGFGDVPDPEPECPTYGQWGVYNKLTYLSAAGNTMCSADILCTGTALPMAVDLLTPGGWYDQGMPDCLLEVGYAALQDCRQAEWSASETCGLDYLLPRTCELEGYEGWPAFQVNAYVDDDGALQYGPYPDAAACQVGVDDGHFDPMATDTGNGFWVLSEPGVCVDDSENVDVWFQDDAFVEKRDELGIPGWGFANVKLSAVRCCDAGEADGVSFCSDSESRRQLSQKFEATSKVLQARKVAQAMFEKPMQK
jgi:hypothetical protein